MADITRAEVASLIAEEYAGQVLKAATQGSTVLSSFPTVNMGTKTTHMPVLATLPTASWVTDVDNTGVKPTAQVTWGDQTLVAEEIAVIVPIHENTIDDATEDILSQISDLGGQAIGKTLDQAVMFGTNKPASWMSLDLLAAAVAASQTVAVVDGAASTNDIYGAILQAAGLVADVGFDPSRLLAKRALQYKFANLRDTAGRPVLNGDAIAGFDTAWNRNGAWDSTSATAFVVDPALVRIGVRQDVTVKFLDQATVGGINLAEKDMVALRFKARFAYVLGKPATPETGAQSTPVAAVTPDVTAG